MSDALPLVALSCHQIGLETLDEVIAEYPRRLALDFGLYFLWLLYFYLLWFDLWLDIHRLTLLRHVGYPVINLLHELLRGYFFLHLERDTWR